ncbi:MAG: MFS transporter [Limnobacter sp.]|nr:MFS transporter [Limnobacter sp.]
MARTSDCGAYRLGFLWQSVDLLVLAVFLLGTQSSFFGPAKYAYLPEQLKDHELVLANAVVETATFVAILLGTTIAGAVLSQEAAGSLLYAVCACGLGVALAGLVASYRIPCSAGKDPQLKINWNVLSETWRNVQWVSGVNRVWPSLLGISWLWFMGATYLTQFPLLTKTVFNATAGVATFLLVLFTVGLGVGAFLCEKWSRKRIEPGLVVVGLVVIVVAGVLLHLLLQGYTTPLAPTGLQGFLGSGRNLAVVAVFVLISMGVGLYSVPLYASMQVLAPPLKRSRVVAANNIINAFFMVVSAGLAMGVLVLAQGNVVWVFTMVTAGNLLVLLLWCWLVPHALLRAGLLLHLERSRKPRLERTELLGSEGGMLVVFPQIRAEDILQKIATLPVPVRLVHQDDLPATPLYSWLKRKGFVSQHINLTEPDSMKNLLADIVKSAKANQAVGISHSVCQLLGKKYRLADLPRLLYQKGIVLRVVYVEEYQSDGNELTGPVCRLIQ